MRRRIFGAAAAIGLTALLVPLAGHANSAWPETKSYTVAASAGVDLIAMGVAVNQAGGPLNCATGVGGACFDTAGHEGKTFRVTALDMTGKPVGLFAGFDMDGDGCVACDNSNAGGSADIFFQGTSLVDGFVPGQAADHTLYVFARVMTLNTGDLGSTGTLTLADCTAADCNPQVDNRMGTACVDQRPGDPTGGGTDPRKPCNGTEIRFMYPYPRVP